MKIKEIPEYEKDLESIRTMMERSVKFLSLSGLSGVLAGIYAVVGSVIAYKVIYYNTPPFGYIFHFLSESQAYAQLMWIAFWVLLFSVATGFLFGLRKARKLGVSMWNNTSRQLLFDILFPLGCGGMFVIIMASRGYYDLVAPACLVFYGLALMAGGRHTYEEIRYLGLSEIVIGVGCAWLPGFSLLCWAFGFGLVHIVYGAIMHFRYDR